MWLTAPVDEEEVTPALPAGAGRGLGVLVEVHVGHGHAVAQLEEGEQRVGLRVAQQATRAVRLLRGGEGGNGRQGRRVISMEARCGNNLRRFARTGRSI